MVIEVDSGASDLGSSPSQGHCVVFLGKILNALTVPLRPIVYVYGYWQI